MKHCQIETTEQNYNLQICSIPAQNFTMLTIPLTLTGLFLLLIYGYRKEKIVKTLSRCERIVKNVG